MGACSTSLTDPERNHTPKPRTPPISLPTSGYLKNIPSWFPAQNAHENISKLLHIKAEIGKGATGSVFTGFYNEQECAVKRIKQNALGSTMNFSTEAHALSSLHHPSIIGYIDMLMDHTYFYLVLDKADYDLYQLLRDKKYLSEPRTKRIIHSILSGLAHLHRNAIAHRDLKPENIVFKAGERDRAILIDFGDAEMAICDKIYQEFVGTPCYMSPERLGTHNGEQLKKSDVWACGVMAYEMYSGCRCFEGETQKHVFSKVLRGEWSWKKRKPHVLMQDFVSKCLNPSWKQRLSAKDALNHAWFAEMTKTDEDSVCTEQTSAYESNVWDVCPVTFDPRGSAPMDCCNDGIVTIPPPMDEYDMVRMESFESFDDLSANVGS